MGIVELCRCLGTELAIVMVNLLDLCCDTKNNLR